MMNNEGPGQTMQLGTLLGTSSEQKPEHRLQAAVRKTELIWVFTVICTRTSFSDHLQKL